METQEIKIKKAKLSKGGCVEASYIDADGNEITLKGKNKSHSLPTSPSRRRQTQSTGATLKVLRMLTSSANSM